MERLTKIKFGAVIIPNSDMKYFDIYRKLAEYENTGLEPIEVEQLKKENEELKEYNKKLDYWKSNWYNCYDDIRIRYNELKSSPNKIAIETLEKVKRELFVLTQYREQAIETLDTMIAELKGE